MNGASIDDGALEKQAVWTDLPVFVVLTDDEIDGWKPPDPTGDDDMDHLLGGFYADIAVRHARAIKDPAFITMVMAAIYYKTSRGLIPMGQTEQGFLSRLAKLSYLGSLN